MPPTPRAKATRTSPTAANKRLLATIKTDRAKLATLQKQQKKLLTDLQKTAKAIERAHKAQSDISAKWSKTLDAVAQNLK